MGEILHFVSMNHTDDDSYLAGLYKSINGNYRLMCLSLQVCLTWFLILTMSRLPHTFREPTCTLSAVPLRKSVCQGKYKSITTLRHIIQ